MGKLFFLFVAILFFSNTLAQNVGIGTTTPSKPLDVAIPGGIQISRTENGSASNELFFSDNGQIRSLDDFHRIVFNRSNDQLELQELGKILFKTGNPMTEAMRINGNGYVGIGTTLPIAPNHLLSVAGGITVDYNNQNIGTVAKILSFGSSGDVGIGSYRPGVSPVNYHGLDFYTNYTKRVSIDAAGNVGIGTATPAAKLDVEGNVKIHDGTQAEGKILTSDGDGNAYWNGPIGCAILGLSDDDTIHNFTYTTIKYNNESYDYGNAYDPLTGIYIVPITGLYHFDASIFVKDVTASDGFINLILNLNGGGWKRANTVRSDQSQTFQVVQLSSDVKLNVGDSVKWEVETNISGRIIIDKYESSTYMNIHLVK